MCTRLINRIVRGAVAIVALGFAVHEFTQAGFTAGAAFSGAIALLFGWMAASGKG